MTGTNLNWVDGPWPGKLALAARPRGGEWLADEMASWQRSGVNTVFSLLTDEEERDLDIVEEETEARAQGMNFLSFPIPDRQVPASETSLTNAIELLERQFGCRSECRSALQTRNWPHRACGGLPSSHPRRRR